MHHIHSGWVANSDDEILYFLNNVLHTESHTLSTVDNFFNKRRRSAESNGLFSAGRQAND